MVQVLPYVPGFGERLSDALVNAGGNLAQGYANRIQNQKSQSAMSVLLDPNSSAMQKVLATADLTEQQRQGLSQPLAAVVGPQSQFEQEQRAVPYLMQLSNYFQQPTPQQRAPRSEFKPGMTPQETADINTPVQETSETQAPSSIMTPGEIREENQFQTRSAKAPAPVASDEEKNHLAILSGSTGPIGRAAKARLDQINEKEKRNQERYFKEQERIEKESQRNLQRELQEKGEKAKVKEEDRAEIRKIAEKYKDTQALKKNVSRLEEAKRIIESEPFSFNETWFNTAISSILEEKGMPLGEAFKSSAQQKVWHLLREALQSKEIGGSNPSTREVVLALSSLPSGFKSENANLYIIGNLLNDSLNSLKRSEVINEVRKEGKYLTAPEFISEVEKRMEPYEKENFQKFQNEFNRYEKIEKAKKDVKNMTPPRGSAWVMDPEGIPTIIPNEYLNEALQNGGVLLKK